jgi:polyketide cyclase/dehydrase/lipid transport protein
MGVVRESVLVPLPAGRARELWTDLRRWPTFVEGFARVLESDPEWPAAGSKVVWESIPEGRGRVTERVIESSEEEILTEVFEDALSGRQAATFVSEEGETLVELELDYRLTRTGVLRTIADVIFIRRALSAALARTLRRYAAEAAEEASL